MASKKTQKNKVSQANTAEPGFFKELMNKHVLLIFLVTFLVFGNSLNNKYAYDDKPVIEKNYLVQKGLKGIPALLTTDFWAGYTGVNQANPSYRPLPLVTLAVEHQVWGLNPAVNHFFNLLFYGFCCVMVFLLMREFFGERYPYLPIITALVFCVHPIHSEVVANVKGRDDILALMNGLLALYLSYKYAQNQNKRHLMWGLAFYFFALLSKEHIITWAAVIPLSLYFFTQLPVKKIVSYATPFWVLSLVFMLIRYKIVGGVVQRTDALDNPLLRAEGAGELWASKIAVMGMFIKKLLIPYPMSSDYSFDAIPLSNWGSPEVYVWLAVYGVLAYFAWKGLASKKVYSYAILLFLITIAPISNILFNYVVAFAERAMFTPSLGFVLLLCTIGYSLYAYVRSRSRISEKGLNQAFLAITIALGACYAWWAFQRNPVWKDDLTLFSTDVKTQPNSVRLNMNYAEELIDKNTQQNPVAINDELREAQQCIDKIKSLTPDLARVHLVAGSLDKITGDYESAEKAFLKAKEIDPNNPRIYFNLGIVAQFKEDLEGAKANYEKALEIFPNYAAVLSNLAVIYGRQNQLDKCIELLERSVALEPEGNSAYANLERAYSLKGDKIKSNYYKNLKQKMNK